MAVPGVNPEIVPESLFTVQIDPTFIFLKTPFLSKASVLLSQV